MTLAQRKTYRFERTILYNNVITESLYGVSLSPDRVPTIGGVKRILAGSFLAAGERILPRATIASPYASGGATVVTNNPWVFQMGDVLRAIGTPNSTPQQEWEAVTAGTATPLGTVTAINNLSVKQKTVLTPNSVAVGNIFRITVDGAAIAFTATAASTANVTAGLKAAFDLARGSTSSLQDIDATDTGTTLELTHTEEGEIFTVVPSVLQGTAGTLGTMTAAIAAPVGALTITPAGGNGNLAIGSKVGAIADVPLGIIAHDYWFTDSGDGLHYSRDFAAYNKAAIYSKGLPYLDGHLVRALPGLSFIPAYGT